MFVQQVMQHTTEALKDKELLLATSARIYIPFVELGDASEYYRHDMLHLLGSRGVDALRNVNGLDKDSVVNAGIEIDCVISIEIDDAVIEQRMTGRRVCGSCGASYHIAAHPPKVEGVCDACGKELVIRKDDAPETVKNRLKVFHAETEPLKNFYEKLGVLKLVEGNQPIESATKDILAALGV